MSDARAQKHILGLDIIRAAAAVMVMTYHLTFFVNIGAPFGDGASIGQHPKFGWAAPYTWFGYVGVEIFFVLSGLVIAYSAQRATASQFLRGRIVRLYPAAWICATFTFIVLRGSGEHYLGGSYLRSVLLSPAPAWIDHSYWTLPIEIGFYALMYVLLLCGLFRYNRIVVGAFGAVSVGLAIHQLLYPASVFLPFAGEALNGSKRWVLEELLLRHGMFFALGNMLWAILFERATLIRWLCSLFFVCGGALEILLRERDLSAAAHLPAVPAVPICVWLAAVLLMIFSVKFNAWVHRLCGLRGAAIVRRMGLASYPLYLIHQDAGYVLLHKADGRAPDVVALLGTSALMITISMIISPGLEGRVQKVLKRILERRPAEKIPAAAGNTD